MKIETNFERPIADQLMEEAAQAFMEVGTPLVVDEAGAPNARRLDDFGFSLDALVEIADVLRPNDPWALMRNALRGQARGYEKNRLFKPGGLLQPDILRTVRERRQIFDFADRAWRD